MPHVEELLDRAEALGARFIIDGDHVEVLAPAPLPRALVDELRENKREIRAVLEPPPTRADPGLILLEQWRSSSIPRWRTILKQSIEEGDGRREEYAREMLRNVIEDPEYPEGADD